MIKEALQKEQFWTEEEMDEDDAINADIERWEREDDEYEDVRFSDERLAQEEDDELQRLLDLGLMQDDPMFFQ